MRKEDKVGKEGKEEKIELMEDQNYMALNEKDSTSSYEKDQRYILKSLDEIKDNQKAINKEIETTRKETSLELANIRVEIALLKVKSSLWGGGAGIIAYALTYAIEYLKRR